MKVSTLLALAWLTGLPAAYGDQGSFLNSGGSASAAGGIVIYAPVASPAGTLSINCPQTGPGTCSGGSLGFISSDGTTTISAVFTSGSFAEGCSGGGRDGHITCSYSFNGSFSGTLTVNSQAQAINGATSQAFGTSGAGGPGSTAYNSAYTPFYYSDTEQILRSDDLEGTNQITYGTQGGGVGQFYGAYGLALDSSRRIYVSDTYNCRVVRIDDMNGTNWTTYGGTCGSGQGQFYDPSGIAVDSAGRIYIMDTGNSRLVRIDDMSGANWTVFSSVGSGTGQLSQFVNVAVDSANRIYVPDAGRVVRIDDMTGANFTVLTQSPVINGSIYLFQNPVAVALDAAGRIYVADNQGYQPAVIRVDDMTGKNWTSVYTGPGGGLNSISVDPTGIVFTGGGGAKVIDGMSAVLNSSGSVAPYGSYYIFGVTPVPVATPRPSAIRFSPSTLSFTQNIGSTSAPAPLIITNFGGSTLHIAGVSASAGYAAASNCSTLPAGASCTVNVTFAPTIAGETDGVLSVNDDSGNWGSAQAIVLTGVGTAPAASVTPASLSFQSQVINTTSSARTLTLQSNGTGPLQITGVTATGPFSPSGNCSGTIATGTSCTIQVTFTPTALGSASGALSIADNAGTQTVTLSGSGVAPVTFSSTSLGLGTVAVGYTSAARTVTVTNRLTTTLSFTGIAASAGFAVASNACGTGIAAGASCTVGVTFTPTAIGNVTGTLVFTDSAATSPQTVSLSGTGSAPVTFSSNSIEFNTTLIGNTSSARSVTVTNRETATLSFASVAASAGFAVASNSCGSSIAAGATCTVGVTFSPTTTGNVSGTLTFTDDAATSPQSVTLTGTGSAPVTFSTSSVNFGSVTVGTTSSTRSVTVTNRLNSALSFTSIAASAGFVIASNSCGTSIAAGANCTVGVTFSPAATGPATGALTFTDSAFTSPQSVTLTGTGM
jgi:sugar lactone lactonase YvrE